MNFMIVFQQMLVLFAMMAAGFIAFKKGIIEEQGTKTISAVIVNLLNPFLSISCVLNKEITFPMKVILQDLIMVAILFGSLILLSPFIAKLLHVSKVDQGSYRMMLVFSNLGFMGVPLVQNIYGPETVLLVAFYMLAYNILIYTYGIYLCSTELESEEGGMKFEWKKMLNPGLISCLVAILLFAFRIQVPNGVATFCSYMGNAAVPLAMIMVGVSLTKINLKIILQDWKLLLVILCKMVVIPIAAVLLLKNFGFEERVLGVFAIMISAPVGSIVTLVESQYGREDNTLCAMGIAVTTLVALFTIPLVASFV